MPTIYRFEHSKHRTGPFRSEHGGREVREFSESVCMTMSSRHPTALVDIDRYTDALVCAVPDLDLIPFWFTRDLLKRGYELGYVVRAYHCKCIHRGDSGTQVAFNPKNAKLRDTFELDEVLEVYEEFVEAA